MDGKHLVQSGAIVRHIARTNNLYGSDEDKMTMWIILNFYIACILATLFVSVFAGICFCFCLCLTCLLINNLIPYLWKTFLVDDLSLIQGGCLLWRVQGFLETNHANWCGVPVRQGSRKHWSNCEEISGSLWTGFNETDLKCQLMCSFRLQAKTEKM